jgi:hypothetical protein
METEELGRQLVEVLGEVPDPRGRRGRRYPLPAILTQTVAALLSGAQSLAAITQWGQVQRQEVVQALGYERGRTPSIGTLHDLYRRLDVMALEAVIARWAQAHLGPDDRTVAVDGKALRGTYGEQTPGLMVLAAFTHAAGQVLAQGGDRDRRS